MKPSSKSKINIFHKSELIQGYVPSRGCRGGKINTQRIDLTKIYQYQNHYNIVGLDAILKIKLLKNFCIILHLYHN